MFKPLILWFVQPCVCEHLVQGSYLPSKGPQGTEDVSAEGKSEDKKQSEGGLQYIPQQEVWPDLQPLWYFYDAELERIPPAFSKYDNVRVQED